MAFNTTSNINPTSGSLTADTPAAPSKGGKSKAARNKAAVTTASSPTEIVFKDQPSPYQAPRPPFIWIDHPQERERLRGPVYVIRLGVGGAQHVEICVDGGPWQNCRLNSGYWWYDWHGIQPGKHTLEARMRTTDGRWFRTPTRNCDYRP